MMEIAVSQDEDDDGSQDSSLGLDDEVANQQARLAEIQAEARRAQEKAALKVFGEENENEQGIEPDIAHIQRQTNELKRFEQFEKPEESEDWENNSTGLEDEVARQQARFAEIQLQANKKALSDNSG